jgi:hypothetical protein
VKRVGLHALALAAPLLLLGACDRVDPSAGPARVSTPAAGAGAYRTTALAGALPAADTEIGRLAGRCTKPLYCGRIGYVDCGSAADGPAYYFERESGKVLGYCGGYCMMDQKGQCRTSCPPKAWTCGR